MSDLEGDFGRLALAEVVDAEEDRAAGEGGDAAEGEKVGGGAQPVVGATIVVEAAGRRVAAELQFGQLAVGLGEGDAAGHDAGHATDVHQDTGLRAWGEHDRLAVVGEQGAHLGLLGQGAEAGCEQEQHLIFSWLLGKVDQQI